MKKKGTDSRLTQSLKQGFTVALHKHQSGFGTDAKRERWGERDPFFIKNKGKVGKVADGTPF